MSSTIRETIFSVSLLKGEQIDFKFSRGCEVEFPVDSMFLTDKMCPVGSANDVCTNDFTNEVCFVIFTDEVCMVSFAVGSTNDVCTNGFTDEFVFLADEVCFVIFTDKVCFGELTDEVFFGGFADEVCFGEFADEVCLVTTPDDVWPVFLKKETAEGFFSDLLMGLFCIGVVVEEPRRGDKVGIPEPARERGLEPRIV